MYFFDKDFLRQQLNTGLPLKIFHAGEWYEVADMSDLNDDVEGIGYNQFGQEHYFKYMEVEQIKTGNKLLTSDQLQSRYGQEPEEKPEGKPKDEEEPPLDGGGEEELPAEDEEPPKDLEKAHYSPYDIGRKLMHELQRKRNWK